MQTVLLEAEVMEPSTGFRLHRESELPHMLRTMGYPQYTLDTATASDGQRPTELASYSEERRQIMAISQIVCQAAIETVSGDRPAHQMQRWCAREVHQKIAQRAMLTAEVPHLRPEAQRVQFRSLRALPVTSTAWEVSVIFADSRRVRACALRLEAHRRRWRVVAMELG